MSFADKILEFNSRLKFEGTLPAGISIMNPFLDQQIQSITSLFYRKYYSDDRQRRLILGINPGRFGAGVTGIPFTDTKRLQEKCGIPFDGKDTHEPSSVFVYRVIEAYGGPEAFYRDFFIGAVCPLGFTRMGTNGREVNYNYYDDKTLQSAVYGFILENLEKQLRFGIDRDVCFCLGTGKNYRFLETLNRKYRFFGQIIPLDHPRFIMQYRAKLVEEYTGEYIRKLKGG